MKEEYSQLVSVATPVTTNMRLKLIMNSRIKAWPYPPEGTVTPPLMKGWKTSFKANEEHSDANTCALIYEGTCTQFIMAI